MSLAHCRDFGDAIWLHSLSAFDPGVAFRLFQNKSVALHNFLPFLLPLLRNRSCRSGRARSEFFKRRCAHLQPIRRRRRSQPMRRGALKNLADEYQRCLTTLTNFAVHFHQVAFQPRKQGQPKSDLSTTGRATSRCDVIRLLFGQVGLRCSPINTHTSAEP